MRCSSGRAKAKDMKGKEREKESLILVKENQRVKASLSPKERDLVKTKVQMLRLFVTIVVSRVISKRIVSSFNVIKMVIYKGGGKGKYGNAVRQVQIEEVPEGSSNTEAAASSSSSPPSKPAVRLVERVFDLTAVPESSSNGAVRVVSNVHDLCTSSFKHDGVPCICTTDADRCTFDFDFEQFDMSSSDLDGNWTESPWLHESITSHIRMLNDDDQGLNDIVLDSGADVSALPLCYSGVGTPVSHDGSLFVDAQGNALHIDSTR